MEGLVIFMRSVRLILADLMMLSNGCSIDVVRLLLVVLGISML